MKSFNDKKIKKKKHFFIVIEISRFVADLFSILIKKKWFHNLKEVFSFVKPINYLFRPVQVNIWTSIVIKEFVLHEQIFEKISKIKANAFKSSTNRPWFT